MVTPVNIRPELMPSLRAEKKSLQRSYVQISVACMFSAFTPVSCSCIWLQRGRLICHFSCRCAISCIGKAALAKASYTSLPTSKLCNEMPGPMMARSDCGLVPKAVRICAMVFCAMRFTVPRHPAWIAAVARCSAS